MTIEQIYTGCLAQGAYYIESNGEAAVIDPLREVTPYIKRAQRGTGAKIKYVFETHFHADFVSGHLDLAQKTGATIIYGPKANTGFDCYNATDGEEFQLGKIKIKALHTPGHTLESTCYLIFDEQGKEHALFSGDTLFIGDVGRPDLAQKSDLTMTDLAGMLYDSLNTKIKILPDNTIIFPAHGAGSACGKNMSKETTDTLGNQKILNYALKATSKEQFIKEVTEGMTAPPAYFPQNVSLNKNGYSSFDSILSQSMIPLDTEAFLAIGNKSHAIVLDTRDAADYGKGSVPGSINIGLNGQFAPWVGAIIADVNLPILLITAIGKEEETMTRLSRVGFDHVIGYLDGGFETWQKQNHTIDTVQQITAQNFADQYQPTQKIIDIRQEVAYRAKHINNATNKPLNDINDWLATIETTTHFYIHCAAGYRSMIASSILKSRGITNFTEIIGGFEAITKTQVPQTDFICQSKTTAP
jgi:hydroxyacylglutathione hydrolase